LGGDKTWTNLLLTAYKKSFQKLLSWTDAYIYFMKFRERIRILDGYLKLRFDCVYCVHTWREITKWGAPDATAAFFNRSDHDTHIHTHTYIGTYIRMNVYKYFDFDIPHIHMYKCMYVRTYIFWSRHATHTYVHMNMYVHTYSDHDMPHIHMYFLLSNNEHFRDKR
jgi:hypothetical protein